MRHLDNFTTSLRKLLGGRQFPASTDGHLLERFVRHHDESAFAGLLQRHGPLVIGACRRVLQDPHDVDDAFQATFLVLVRKARSLGRKGSIASWLYTVAYHIALKAKARAARQRDLQQRRAAMPAPTSDEGLWRDLRPVLDEELNRLPDKYRAPLVLCYLQGKTNDEAAEALGWTKGTVSGRLARARDLLRGRLVRRGITLSAPSLATVLADEAAAAVPIELGRATGKAALLLTTGQPLAAIAQPPVAQLVSGAVQRLFLARASTAAVVLVLLGCLAALAAAMVPLLLQSVASPEPADNALAQRGRARQVVVVEALYPGANPMVVATTVARPIEQQVRGVDGMVDMKGHCMYGRYLLEVSFPSDANLDLAQVLVQNRVSLALPQLSPEVQKVGVSVRKKTRSAALMAILSAPQGKHDVQYLSNYARTQLYEPLMRLPGVGDVRGVDTEGRLQVRWDPEKLDKNNLTLGEAAGALKRANGAVAGKPVDLSQVNNIVLKADPLVHVSDVGSAEWELDPANQATLNGRPVVALAIYALSGASVQNLPATLTLAISELRKSLPAGLQLEVAFDFTKIQASPEYVILDVDWPKGVPPERTWEKLQDIAKLVQGIQGVDAVLTLGENPFDHTRGCHCVLVRLQGQNTAQAITQQIKAELTRKIPTAAVRFRDASGPGQTPEWGYPIDLGITGPDSQLEGDGDLLVIDMAEKLVNRLVESKRFMDIQAHLFETSWLTFTPDDDAARAEGVAMDDIFAAVQASTTRNVGPFTFLPNNRNRWEEVCRTVKVRNKKGELIPLGRLVRENGKNTDLLVYDRFNGEPMVRITASPKPGVPEGEARRLCETLADEARKELRLPATYRLVWLREDAAKR
jgi:RNA polymerase sigma factor (sigma-70 family)